MKIFQRVRKQYAILGISNPSNQPIQETPFNKRVLAGFSFFAYIYTSEIVFIVQEANGLMEYIEGLSSLSAVFVLIVCFAAIVFRKATLFKNIDNIEKLFDTSETITKFINDFIETDNKIHVSQDVNTRNRKHHFPRPINKWNNWVKSPSPCSWKLYYNVSCYQNALSAMAFTSSPILEMSHFNCHFLFGKVSF